MATNLWTDVTWQLGKLDGAVSALFKTGTGSGKNRFRLAHVSVGSTQCYPVQFRNDAMTKYWKDLVFVSRGNRAPTLPPAAKRVLAKGQTPARLQEAARIFIAVAVARRRISTQRLECDVSIAVPRSSRLEFGRLQLFAFPGALKQNRALLVVRFEADSQPNGTGGGGSIHD